MRVDKRTAYKAAVDDLQWAIRVMLLAKRLDDQEKFDESSVRYLSAYGSARAAYGLLELGAEGPGVEKAWKDAGALIAQLEATLRERLGVPPGVLPGPPGPAHTPAPTGPVPLRVIEGGAGEDNPVIDLKERLLELNPDAPAVSPYQRRMLDWMQQKHPDEWVQVGGVNLQVGRGLEKQGLAEIRGRSGEWKLRLTPRGKTA